MTHPNATTTQAKADVRTGERHTAPTAIDLFSGCGGVTCGLKQAGFRVLAAIECDPLALEAYEENHPEVVTWGRDIREVRVADVAERLRLLPGDLDLLAGCPPCQGFSSLRTLNGGRAIDDSRNDLVLEYARFALGLRPKVLMFENVPGLAEDPRMTHLLRKLRAVGYRCRTAVLDAADYGVPQRRRRMLMLAAKGGDVPFAPPESQRPTVGDYIGALAPPEMSDDLAHNHGESRSAAVRRLIAAIPRDGGSRSSLSKTRQLPCHKRCDGFYDIYGRMSWKYPSPTITTGCINPSKGRFLHPEQDRAITVREAAMLQTFPVDYYVPMHRGKYRAAELIGNAFPPEFVRRHALVLAEHLAGPSPSTAR